MINSAFQKVPFKTEKVKARSWTKFFFILNSNQHTLRWTSHLFEVIQAAMRWQAQNQREWRDDVQAADEGPRCVCEDILLLPCASRLLRPFAPILSSPAPRILPSTRSPKDTQYINKGKGNTRQCKYAHTNLFFKVAFFRLKSFDLHKKRNERRVNIKGEEKHKGVKA